MTEVQSVMAKDLRPGDRIVDRQIERVTRRDLVGGIVHVHVVRPWKSRYFPDRQMRIAHVYRPGEPVLIVARPKRTTSAT